MIPKMNNLQNFKCGFKDAFPIFLGYFAVSFTLGIAARQVGLTAFQATFMSVTNYASAGQFAALGLISIGVSYLEMAATQFVVNMRYFLMSCSLSQKLKPNTPLYQRLLLAGTLTDEVFGLSIATEGKLKPAYSFGAMTFSALGWGGGTLAGVISGSILPPGILSALSVALYGMFIAIIMPKAKESKFFAGLIAISMLLSLIFSLIPLVKEISGGIRIIILTLVIAGIAAVIKPIEEEEK
jgi:predicted branched-subunit amino acid permease